MEIEVSPTPSRLLRISTEMFPERERFSAFREEFARRILAMDVIDQSGGGPLPHPALMPPVPPPPWARHPPPARRTRPHPHPPTPHNLYPTSSSPSHRPP